MADPIQRAVEVVGPDDPDDYAIQPSAFAARFTRDAPEFAELLADPKLTALAALYESHDADANRDKRRFEGTSGNAALFMLVATIVSALLVSSASQGLLDWLGVPADASALRWLRYLLAGAAAVFGGVAIYNVTYMNRSGLFASWMSARAEAEVHRLEYFTELGNLATARHADRPDLLLLALELFRRYQVSVQLLYYDGARQRHRERQLVTARIAAWGAVVVTLCGGAFGFAGALKENLLPLASLGAIGAGLATWANQREALKQDSRNHTRYTRAFQALTEVRANHAAVGAGLAAGESKVLSEYVAAVHERLAAEHREWLKDSKAIDSATKTLESSLAKMK